MNDDSVPASSFDTWALPPQPPSLPSTPPVQRPRRASRSLTLAVAMIATVLVGAAGGVAVAFATRSQPSAPTGGSLTPDPTNPSTSQASALYQQALSTTGGAAGFKYVSVSTGTLSETIAGVAGQLGGRQDITCNSSYGGEQFTLLLVGTTVYFQGNTPAIEDQLGVAAAGAPKLAGKWVSVAAGNAPYGVLQPGIRAGDQAQQMPLVPTSTTRLTTSDGIAATRILGTLPTQPGTAHLDIATGTGIPLSYVMRFTINGTTATTTTTFSQWGTAPSVSAPSGTVAWSTLVTSPPPGGYGTCGASSPPPSGTPQPAI
jgi:hypothetical protein